VSEERWSKEAELHQGALARHGWKEHESAEERHRALERSVRADGYKTTVERLVFMENVANRKDNRGLHETAHADLEWIQRWERVTEGDEDRRRAWGRQHRVEAYRKDDGTNVHSHLADNPRRR
jgi:hypothetical protein